eukprot:RCo050057
MPLIVVGVVRAQNLGNMNAPEEERRQLCPFVQLTMGSQDGPQRVQQTAVKPHDPNPQFLEEFAFYVGSPARAKLTVEALHLGPSGQTTSLGKQIVRLDRLHRGRTSELWCRVQGLGAVLVWIRALDFGHPPAGPLGPQEALAEDKFLSGHRKKLVVAVLKATDLRLPTKTGECIVAVSMGDFTARSPPQPLTRAPTFNDTFIVPVQDEATQYLELEVRTTEPSSTLLGKCSTYISDLQRGSSNCCWLDLMVPEKQGSGWEATKEGSKLRVVLSPIGYGRPEPEAEPLVLQRRRTRSSVSYQNTAELLGGAPGDDGIQSYPDVLDVEVVEALGGRYTTIPELRPVVRVSVRGASQSTVTPQHSLVRPQWNETFRFPIREPKKELVYVELLSDGALLGECTLQLHQITKEPLDLFLIMVFDEELETDEEDPPKVHLRVRARGPNIAAGRGSTTTGSAAHPPPSHVNPSILRRPSGLPVSPAMGPPLSPPEALKSLSLDGLGFRPPAPGSFSSPSSGQRFVPPATPPEEEVGRTLAFAPAPPPAPPKKSFSRASSAVSITTEQQHTSFFRTTVLPPGPPPPPPPPPRGPPPPPPP